jgi:hypothetical protein
MRTLAIIALMAALLPAIAHAQQQQRPPTPFERTAEQKKKDAEVEKAYQDALKADKAKATPAKIDPWQTIRPAGAGNVNQ